MKALRYLGGGMKAAYEFIYGCFAEAHARMSEEPLEPMSEDELEFWRFFRTVFFWKTWIALAVGMLIVDAAIKAAGWAVIAMCFITSFLCDLCGIAV